MCEKHHLHQELAVLQALHSALADYGCNVVLVVCQAVQGESGIVLQVSISGRHELQQRREPASLHMNAKSIGTTSISTHARIPVC